jgi:hypothetical protein
MVAPSIRLAVRLASVAALAAALPARGAPRSGPTAALTAEEIADLRYLREEEKLAHDVYVALYQAWRIEVFSVISQDEQRHVEAVKGLLARYGIADTAAGTAPGVFVAPALQSQYDILVASGLASPSAAIAVGLLIETTDVADLKAAMARTTHAPILRVYGALLEVSNGHLAALREATR